MENFTDIYSKTVKYTGGTEDGHPYFYEALTLTPTRKKVATVSGAGAPSKHFEADLLTLSDGEDYPLSAVISLANQGKMGLKIEA